MAWNLVELPFAADRDPVVVDVLGKHLAALGRSESGLDSAGPASRVLVICESRMRSRHVRELAIRKLGMAPAGFYGTIDDIVLEVAREAVFPGVEAGGDIGGSAGRCLSFLTDVQNRRLIRSALRFCGGSAGGRGVSARTIDEMQTALARVRNSIAPESRESVLKELESVLGKSDPHLAARVAIVRACLAYQSDGLRRLGESCGQWLVDSGDAEWLVAAAGAEVLGGYGLVMVDDVYRLGAAQRQFLGAIGRHCRNSVWIRRGQPGSGKWQQVTGADGGVVDLASASGVAESHWRCSDDRRRVLEGLVSGVGAAVEFGGDAGVRVARYQGVPEEARTVVARAKSLHVLGGVPLAEIGICLVDKADEDAFAAELEAAGVPYVRSAPVPVVHAPAVQVLFGLADAAASGWPMEDTLRVLRSRWLEGLGALLVGEKAGRWESEVDALLRAGRRAVECAPDLVGGAGGSLKAWRKALEVPDRSVGTLWQKWEPVLSVLDGMSGCRSAGELAAALVRVIEMSGMAARATRQRRGAYAEKSGGADAVRRLWNVDCVELVGRALIEAASAEREPVSGTVAAWAELRDGIAGLAKAMRMRGDAVRLVGLLDVRGRPFRQVFVCGMDLASMPFPDPENAWFPRRIREAGAGGTDGALAAALDGLAADVNPLAEYRHLLACALANGPEGLELSWPRQRGESPLAPSLPLRELMAVLGVAEDGKDKRDSAAAVGARLAANPALGIGGGEGPDVACFSVRDVAAQLGRQLSGWLADGVGEKQGAGGPLVECAEEEEPAVLGAAVNMSRDELMNFASPWAGRMVTDEVREMALPRPSAEGGELRRISPSRMEHYAACPARWLYQDVMRLEEDEPISASLDVRMRGSLIHQILERFMVRMREEILKRCRDAACYPGVLLEWGADRRVDEGSLESDYRMPSRPGLGPRDLPLVDFGLLGDGAPGPSAKDVMLEVLEEMATLSTSTDWAIWVERERAALLGTAVPSQLAAFIDAEAFTQAPVEIEGEDGELRILPWLFELSVGTEGSPWEAPLSRSNGRPAMRVGVHGKVDRVDAVVRVNGGRVAVEGLLVRDYKSSMGSHAAKLRQGVAFQLPVYALAARDALAPDGDAAIAGFMVQVPMPGVSEPGDPAGPATGARYLSPALHRALTGKFAKNKRQPGDLLDGLLQDRLGRLFGAMEEGYFHPELVAGSQSACAWCHLGSVCAVRRGQQDLLASAGRAAVSMAADGGVAPYYASGAELDRQDGADESGDGE